MQGKRFGNLIVVGFSHRKLNYKIWKCQCDCGAITYVYEGNLKSGGTKSCGCRKRNPNSRYKIDPIFNKIKGVWTGMKTRCYNPKYEHYHIYGGRGIKVCEEWQTLNGFYEWAISNGYREGLQIDRINVNGNYEPSNCRWVTPVENSRNKRNNRLLRFNGEVKTLTEWANDTGVTLKTITDRNDRGWSAQEILLPKRTRDNIRKHTGETFTINGETKSISEWADIAGITYASMRDRINAGWPEDDLLKPKGSRPRKNIFKYTGAKIEFGDGYKSISELADLAGVSYATMKDRIQTGWSQEELLKPKGYRRNIKKGTN